ncbi:hypothetical protein GGS20DRAFT_590559 [Poronia punctata]|nr:hypothetical protein GGS20DRAFT_590559 [Poronia punctata]
MPALEKPLALPTDYDAIGLCTVCLGTPWPIDRGSENNRPELDLPLEFYTITALLTQSIPSPSHMMATTTVASRSTVGPAFNQTKGAPCIIPRTTRPSSKSDAIILLFIIYICVAMFAVKTLWLMLSRNYVLGAHENMSPESALSLFPDRPIRPLPKRRLRERLSPDVANSIKFPPAPQPSAPLFVYPYSPRDDSSPVGPELIGLAPRENVARPSNGATFRRNGLATGPRDDESLMSQARRALGSRGFHEPVEQSFRVPPRASHVRPPKPQPPPSTASSMDGYESFENTNNKKKRKIPIAGESILNGTHTITEPTAFGIQPPSVNGEDDSGEPVPTSTPYYQTGGPLNNGQGISGPGRGRYGRARNGRSPLRTLSDSNGNWAGRNMKLRSPNQYPSPPAENAGIISTAMASIEKLPLPTGQENISLLQQQTPPKPSPRSSTQFTFTFGSQNPVSWPGSDPAPHSMGGSNRNHHPANSVDYHGVHARGTQTHSGVSSLSAPGTSQNGSYPSIDPSGKGGPNATASQKKTKRRGDPLLRAARQRRKETMFQNMHHPPSPENYYLCEFCEYELIFGHPPEALIRQYEIKDRRRRREEAERRRLLEKAKMKSRKGKKPSNSKSATKNNSVSDRASVSAPDMQHRSVAPHDLGPDEGDDGRSEAFDSEDHYDDQVSPDHERAPQKPAIPRAPPIIQTHGKIAPTGSGGGPIETA